MLKNYPNLPSPPLFILKKITFLKPSSFPPIHLFFDAKFIINNINIVIEHISQLLKIIFIIIFLYL